MKIRFAELKDVPRLVEIGKVFHANTRFRVYEYDAAMVEKKLTDLIVSGGAGRYVFFVADDSSGTIVGVLIGCLETHIFSTKLNATIVHFDVLPDKRMGGAAVRLLTAFRKWSENRGVFEFCVGVNSGENLAKLDRFFKKLGFKPTGGNYAMQLAKAA